jgi:hypothetical protein
MTQDDFALRKSRISVHYNIANDRQLPISLLLFSPQEKVQLPKSQRPLTHLSKVRIHPFNPLKLSPNKISGSNGAFLENCKPSQINPNWSWASGKGNADKLWALSEELVGQKFEY